MANEMLLEQITLMPTQELKGQTSQAMGTYTVYSQAQYSTSTSTSPNMTWSSWTKGLHTFVGISSEQSSVNSYLSNIAGNASMLHEWNLLGTSNSIGSFNMSGSTGATTWYPLHESFFNRPELTPTSPLQAERIAFLRMRNELLNSDYRGKYVAILDGKLIDNDQDLRTLAMRVYKKFGYIPIYMDQVTEKERKFENSSPEQSTA
jgi:hypothetical protein